MGYGYGHEAPAYRQAFSKEKIFLLPLAKGGREGFYKEISNS